MFVPLGHAARLPVRLINGSGDGVTGMLPNNVYDGATIGRATVVKADGTLASIALVSNTNWFEINATKAPGLYHVLVPTSATDKAGTMQLCVFPAGVDFKGTVITAQVEKTSFDFFGIGPGSAVIQLTRALDARTIEIVFDRRVVEAAALDITNYNIAPPLDVVSVVKMSDFHYRLTTGQQVIDQLYTITISNIEGV